MAVLTDLTAGGERPLDPGPHQSYVTTGVTFSLQGPKATFASCLPCEGKHTLVPLRRMGTTVPHLKTAGPPSKCDPSLSSRLRGSQWGSPPLLLVAARRGRRQVCTPRG